MQRSPIMPPEQNPEQGSVGVPALMGQMVGNHSKLGCAASITSGLARRDNQSEVRCAFAL